MTKTNALVLDGREVLLRLQAERRSTGNAVHVDWLRFTCELRNAPAPSVDALFPPPQKSTLENPLSPWEEETGTEAQKRHARLLGVLHALPDADFAASAQAHALADKLCKILGSGFAIEPEMKKGHDFYRYRWSITRNGAECAWVGFLASGDSPRQSAQARTIHANVYGSACTFARADWRRRVAKLIQLTSGKITRIDLALDFFEGITGGLDRVREDWHTGAMDVMGKRPKPGTVGPWVEGGRGRSFYSGSKEAGKQTNTYEKGVQLFGEKDATRWERIEIRYGNKLRELPTDMLLRPDDFFAGASDWHQGMLIEHGKTVEPESVPCRKKQAVETVKAEVTRAVRWLNDTASQSMAMAFQFLGTDRFLELVTHRQLPGRLRKFSKEEVMNALADVPKRVFQPRAAMA